MTLSLASLSPSSNLAAAQVNVQTAQGLIAQGDAASPAPAGIDATKVALNDYRQSAGQSEIAALTCQNITDVLSGSNPALAGLHAAVLNEAASATASVTAAGQTTDPATARAAAVAGLHAAQSAIGYASQAVAAPAPSRISVGLGFLLAGGLTAIAWGLWRLRRARP